MEVPTLAWLDDTIEGRVIRPGAPDYDDARRTFNTLIDPHPVAIVRCLSDDDVRAVIGAARREALPLGVRGRGQRPARRRRRPAPVVRLDAHGPGRAPADGGHRNGTRWAAPSCRSGCPTWETRPRERFAVEILGDATLAATGYGACTYLDIQPINAIEAVGSRNHWSSTFVTDLDDELVDRLVDAAPDIPMSSGFLIEPVHGAARRRGAEHAAFAHGSARFHVSALGIWSDPAFDEQGAAWSRSMTERIPEWSSGGLYVNYAMPDEPTSGSRRERARSVCPPDVFERLQAVKRRYDPDNLFRGNMNIPPGAVPRFQV